MSAHSRRRAGGSRSGTPRRPHHQDRLVGGGMMGGFGGGGGGGREVSDVEDELLREKERVNTLKIKCNTQEDVIKRMKTKMAQIEQLMRKRALNPRGAGGGGAAGMAGQLFRKHTDKETDELIKLLRKEKSTLKRRCSHLENLVKKLRADLKRSKVTIKRSRLRRSGASVRSQASPPRKPRGGRGVGDPDGQPAELGFLGGSPSPPRHHRGHRHDGGDSKQQHQPPRMLEDMLRSFATSAPSKRMQKLVDELRGRLVSTETHLQQLTTENEELQRLLREGGAVDGGHHRHPPPPPGVGIGDNYLDGELRSLKRELRDKSAQLTLLETRYDHLKAKAKAEMDIQDQTMEQMESYNKQVLDLTRQLQEANVDRSRMRGYKVRVFEILKFDFKQNSKKNNTFNLFNLKYLLKTIIKHPPTHTHTHTPKNLYKTEVEELESELRAARQEARDLEDRNLQLCESPFINDAVERRDRIKKMSKLEKTSRQQNAQIAHLQETVRFCFQVL